MEFSNPQVPEGINSDAQQTLRHFALQTALVVAIVVGCLTALSFASSLIAPHIPFSWEKYLADKTFSRIQTDSEHQLQEQELRRIAEQIVDALEVPESIQISVHYSTKQTANAFATIGGIIVVHQGILDKLDAEDELVVLLAHEIAHVKHRHVARTVFRCILEAILFSGSSSVSPMLQRIEELSLRSFSRHQERLADQEATRAAALIYGHTAGAIRLFETLKKEMYGDRNEILEIVSSHPNFDHRIQDIYEQSLKMNCPTEGKLTKLNDVFKNSSKEKETKD